MSFFLFENEIKSVLDAIYGKTNNVFVDILNNYLTEKLIMCL